MEQGPSWDVNTSDDSKELSTFYRTPRLVIVSTTTPRPVLILSQINPHHVPSHSTSSLFILLLFTHICLGRIKDSLQNIPRYATPHRVQQLLATEMWHLSAILDRGLSTWTYILALSSWNMTLYKENDLRYGKKMWQIMPAYCNLKLQ